MRGIIVSAAAAFALVVVALIGLALGQDWLRAPLLGNISASTVLVVVGYCMAAFQFLMASIAFVRGGRGDDLQRSMKQSRSAALRLSGGMMLFGSSIFLASTLS